MKPPTSQSLSEDARLADLIVRWEELQQGGRDVSVEELCRDCPDLLDAVREHIGALQAMNEVLVAGGGWGTTTSEAPPAGVPPEQTLSDQPGRIGRAPCIPGYEILSELGRGGMGVVYKARQLGLGRLVALKMILAGAQARAIELARFRTEAEAIARLQHPNIVQIYEVGEHEGLPFFSLELCSGGSLERKLAGAPQSPAQAAQLLQTLARAMHAAHEQHVIHRDLKPANVLLTADGTPKITDFGLAKKLDEVGQTANTGVMGTPAYMAPEQASGKTKTLGPAVDVYALGVILYQVLTGRPPFLAATALETLMQTLHDQPVPPRRLQPSVPRDLETICLKCLQKAPGKRYASAAALADDLDRFLSGKPILGRPVPVWERAYRWARSHPGPAGFLAASLTAMAIFVGLILSYQQVLQQRVAEAVANERRQRNRAIEAEHREHAALEFQKEKYKRMARFLASLNYSLSELPELPATQDVRLRVGVASEVRGGVREGFEAYELFRGEYFRRSGRRFQIEVNAFPDHYAHGEALREFQSPAGKGYDILLIDDPWLAMLYQKLTPLDEVAGYREYLARNPPLNAFVPSLSKACTYPENGRLYGLPLVGNVQLLMYRKDLLPAGLDPPNHHRDEDRLWSIERLCDRARGIQGWTGSPFVVRFRDAGSITEQFWEVLRCYGYRDKVKDGRVVIPRAWRRRRLPGCAGWTRRAISTDTTTISWASSFSRKANRRCS